MLEKACQDLIEGALPIAESEAAVGWDRVELAVGERGDFCKRLAGS